RHRLRGRRGAEARGQGRDRAPQDAPNAETGTEGQDRGAEEAEGEGAIESAGPSDNSALIDITDIRKVYEMGSTEVNALDGVSLHVRKGEYLAIMGPSGSGKSTLMNIVGCLDTPTSGSYKLRGTEIRERDDDELARIRN